jgi:hypothetical protein
MNSFEAYCMYLGLKNHFTRDDYDYIKYKGKVKASVESFHKRKDMLFFEKLAKHKDLLGFLVSNLSVNPKQYVRDLAYSEVASRVYIDWMKRNQSLTYSFTNDLSKLKDSFIDNFTVVNGNHPYLIKALMSGEMSIEPICILCSVSKCIGYWDRKLNDDFIYNEERRRIVKYTPFVNYDEPKIRSAIKNRFNSTYAV